MRGWRGPLEPPGKTGIVWKHLERASMCVWGGQCLLLQGPAQPPPPQRPDCTGSHTAGSREAQSLLSTSQHSAGTHWVPAQGSQRAGLKGVFPRGRSCLFPSSILTPSRCQGDGVGGGGQKPELGVSITCHWKSPLPLSGLLLPVPPPSLPLTTLQAFLSRGPQGRASMPPGW